MRPVLAAVLLAGCASDPPEISIDVSPINVGVWSTDPSAEARRFDFQLINEGGGVLSIESVSFRGDQNCAFTFEGPDYTELGEGDAGFVRGWYAPTVEGEDHIAMDVVSNAENYPTFTVAICGKAVALGSQDTTPIEACQDPPSDQPDCE